jgi:D-alanine-D-alanine ligase
MKIGITFDLKTDLSGDEPGLPDDFQEEFDSPATIEAIASALRSLGYEVVLLGDGRALIEKLLEQPPDFVFNFAEGHGVSRSREARVPAVLEMLGIPYTGSDPLTMAVTLDKDCARRLVASTGIAVPNAVVIAPGESGSVNGVLDAAHGSNMSYFGRTPCRSSVAGLTFPVIVKPAWEGSSKGIRRNCLAHSPHGLTEAVTRLHAEQRQPVLVEEYIQGDELTVGVLGNEHPRVIGIMRVVPKERVEHFIYSLEVKRDYKNQVRYECPAALDKTVADRVGESALAIHRVLGCRDVSRVDFRLRDGVPYFLEVNPLPGLNPADSDLVIMSRLLGWSYEKLIVSILNSALARCGIRSDLPAEQPRFNDMA